MPAVDAIDSARIEQKSGEISVKSWRFSFRNILLRKISKLAVLRVTK